jgi:hypothetical protein
VENRPNDEYRRRPDSIFFPILLVVLGVFFLLANLGTIQNTPWGILSTYWPLIFIIGALDALYRRDGWVGPLVGIGLGTVLLLGNLHYFQWGSLELLLRLWPILLVAWGLDIAFGHDHSATGTVVRVGLGLLLVAGIVWMTLNSPFGAGVKKKSISQSLDGATESTLNFSMAAGTLNVSGGAEDALLMNGTIGLPKEMTLSPDYQAPVDGSSSLSLEGAGVVLLPFGEPAPWDMQVNSTIPLSMDTHMGLGNQNVDLSNTQAKEILSQTAVGQTTLTLPEKGSATGTVQVAVGELVIRVPKGRHVIFHTSDGAVTNLLPTGYTNTNGVIESAAREGDTVELNIEVALGSLVIQEIQ